MKTLNLREAIPESVKALQESGEPASFTTVLQMLGIAQAPTLPHDGAIEPSPRAEGAVSLGRFQLLGEQEAAAWARCSRLATRSCVAR